MMISIRKFAPAAAVFGLLATQGLSSAATLDCPKAPVTYSDDGYLAIVFDELDDNFYEGMIQPDPASPLPSLFTGDPEVSIFPRKDPIKRGLIQWEVDPLKGATMPICNDDAPFTCESNWRYYEGDKEIEVKEGVYNLFAGKDWCSAKYFSIEDQQSALAAKTIDVLAFGMPRKLLFQVLDLNKSELRGAVDPTISGLANPIHATAVEGSHHWRNMENFIIAAKSMMDYYQPTIFVAPLCKSDEELKVTGYKATGREAGFLLMMPPTAVGNDVIFGRSLNYTIVAHETLKKKVDSFGDEVKVSDFDNACVFSPVTFVFEQKL